MYEIIVISSKNIKIIKLEIITFTRYEINFEAIQILFRCNTLICIITTGKKNIKFLKDLIFQRTSIN